MTDAAVTILESTPRVQSCELRLRWAALRSADRRDYKVLQAVQDRAGIEHFRPYDFRHSAATGALAAARTCARCRPYSATRTLRPRRAICTPTKSGAKTPPSARAIRARRLEGREVSEGGGEDDASRLVRGALAAKFLLVTEKYLAPFEWPFGDAKKSALSLEFRKACPDIDDDILEFLLKWIGSSVASHESGATRPFDKARALEKLKKLLAAMDGRSTHGRTYAPTTCSSNVCAGIFNGAAWKRSGRQARETSMSGVDELRRPSTMIFRPFAHTSPISSRQSNGVAFVHRRFAIPASMNWRRSGTWGH